MKLSFYTVENEYCNWLRQSDPCVAYNMDEKQKRPFVGIVFSINGYNYYAPLSSPKPKHLNMKNQLDFLKINGGEWGAINFNNMIPVPIECLTRVEMRITDSDTTAEKAYKNLLANQLSWCNSNRERIIRQARKLYVLVKEGKAHPELMKRCCDFGLCEMLSKKYIDD